ncbi:MAG: PcfJ domain-containing protein [Pseudomonadota bacterium]
MTVTKGVEAARKAKTLSDKDARSPTQAGRRNRRLVGFRPEFRNYISQLTSSSPKLEDLADSFPALLFALATGYGTQRQRGRAFTLIAEGRSLKDAATALGVPLWMRRLPASALEHRLEAIPTSPEFDAAIAHLIPSTPDIAAAWLSRVLYAAEACGEPFALWTAKHHRTAAVAADDEMFRYQCAWAWFTTADDTVGAQILRRPWTPSISPRRVSEEVVIWRRRLALAYALAARPDSADWAEPRDVNGHSFVPLTSVQDFVDEGEAMTNCLDQYTGQLDDGAVSIFSIRRQGRRVANLEIRLDTEEGCAPVISQLKRPRNRHASKLLWQTAYVWLGSQPLRNIGRPKPITRHSHWKAVMSVWAPYLDWLPTRHAQAFELHLRALELPSAASRSANRRSRASRTSPSPRPARSPSTSI